MKQSKILWILVDGIGDLGVPANQKQTTLQSAKIPTMDKLTEKGISGLHDSVEPGYACGSDTSHLNILGYDPFTYYSGRGGFETEGSGLHLEFGEIAFKCNFSYMDPETRIVKKRRVDREFHFWGLDLISVIDGITIPGYEEYKVTAKHATEHRIGLKITGPDLSNHFFGTDPLVDNLVLRKAVAKDKEGEKSADLVNNLTEQIIKVLKEHPVNIKRIKEGKIPANIICLRGAGIKLDLESFPKKHGLKSFAICPTAIIKGLMIMLGVDIINVDGATGDYHTDIEAKAKSAIHHLFEEQYDFGFLHIKAIDECAHDKLVNERIEWLEKVDKMLLNIMEAVKDKNENMLVLITGDHTTSPVIGDHSPECIPITIGSSKAFHGLVEFPLKDACKQFNDIEARKGCLGRFSGSGMMTLIKKLMDII